ncbi:hypothetical protein ACQ86N_45930 [Puia sp. P3]|uniref:hypothetical protein n=1 Tax=Puia sp. P3 TaxID=3423952 RepID=UPI003D66B3B8
MQGIKNIIFDLGGVILNLDNKRTEDAFTSLGVKDFRSYFGHGHASDFFREYEVGGISDRQFIDSIRQLTGISVSDEAIVAGWNALLLDFPPERIQAAETVEEKLQALPFQQYQRPASGCPAKDVYQRVWRRKSGRPF